MNRLRLVRRAPRAAVFAPTWPDHDRASGSQRTLDLIDLLRECGWDVGFFARHPLGDLRHARALHDRGIATHAGFGDGAFERVAAMRPEIALFVYWPTAEDCAARVRRASPGTRLVVDSVDLHLLRRARQRFAPRPGVPAPGALDAVDAMDAARELNVYAEADAVLTVSEREAELLSELLAGATPVLPVPDCEDLPPGRLDFGARRGAVFVGNFRHHPNVDAAERLCRDIVPRLPGPVRAAQPVRIVGYGPSPALVSFARAQGVMVTGFVPSVLPYVEQARAALVPLRHGAGTKRKLIQAVLLGTPVVTTRVGLEGLPLEDGQGVAVTDDDRAFAAATARLLTDEAGWRALAGKGRAALESVHGREAVKARLRAALAEVQRRPPKPTPERVGTALSLAAPDATPREAQPAGHVQEAWADPGDLAAFVRADGLRRADLLDAVLLAPRAWQDGCARSEQIARRLAARGHRVFFVEPAAGGERLRAAAPNLTVAAVPTDAARAAAALDRLRSWFGIHDAFVKADGPRWRETAFELRRRYAWPLVYDAAGPQGRAAGKAEPLLRESDLVLASTDAQGRELARLRAGNVLALPDGADVEHLREPIAPPRELDKRPRPIIGCEGAGGELDVRAIEDAARLRPRWTFVVAGETTPGARRRLARRQNVVLAGTPPYRLRPGFLRLFDAGWIATRPRRGGAGERTQRLLEYLAVGLPVVGPLVEDLRGPARRRLVALAGSAADAVRKLERLLGADRAPDRARRRRFADGASWSTRAAELMTAVPGLFPRASIVVVTYNNLACTRRCLDSLFSFTAWPDYEVVVVDNGSTDGTVPYLRALARRERRLRPLFGRRNLGFAPAANRGLRAARGEILVLLNNDTVLTPGWLGGLAAHLTDAGVGAVGPVSNWASGASQVEVDYHTVGEMASFASRYTAAHAHEVVTVDRLAMFCLALPRAVYEELGPLDERFAVGMFEDDDYARRIRATGRRLLSVGDVFVHHVGHATFSALGAGAYDTAFAANRRRFEEKWTTRWATPAPRPSPD